MEVPLIPEENQTWKENERNMRKKIGVAENGAFLFRH